MKFIPLINIIDKSKRTDKFVSFSVIVCIIFCNWIISIISKHNIFYNINITLEKKKYNQINHTGQHRCKDADMELN